jgi:VanZ family protein
MFPTLTHFPDAKPTGRCSYFLMLYASKEARNTNAVVFGLPQRIYRTRREYVNHYTRELAHIIRCLLIAITSYICSRLVAYFYNISALQLVLLFFKESGFNFKIQ